MSSTVRAKKYRENVKKRKLAKKYERFENLSSDEEISNNTLSPKHACSEMENHVNSDVSDEQSVYSDLCDSDKQVQSDSESMSSENNDDFIESIIEIDQLRQWAIYSNTPHSDLDKLLKILRHRLLPNLPLCSKTFLKSNIKYDIKSMEALDGSSGEFYHFGLINQIKETVKLELHVSNILELTFNIDGVSPFKSSNIAVWPFYVKSIQNVKHTSHS